MMIATKFFPFRWSTILGILFSSPPAVCGRFGGMQPSAGAQEDKEYYYLLSQFYYWHIMAYKPETTRNPCPPTTIQGALHCLLLPY